MDTISLTEFKNNVPQFINKISVSEHLVISVSGKPKVVVLSIKEYKKINELLEDKLDQQEAKKLLKEKRGKGISFDQVLAKY